MDLEERIEELNRIPGLAAAEIDAAEVVYQRLLTARSICASALGVYPNNDSPLLGAVLAELGASARAIIADDRNAFAEE